MRTEKKSPNEKKNSGKSMTETRDQKRTQPKQEDLARSKRVEVSL